MEKMDISQKLRKLILAQENVVVSCNTEKKAKNLFETLKTLGIVFFDKGNSEWSRHENQTGYLIHKDKKNNVSVSYNSLSYYKKRGYNIYTFFDLIDKSYQNNQELESLD